MDGVIGTRLDDLHGLLNGIDTAVWNPATDKSLPARYSSDDLAGKAKCRAKLLKEFGWSTAFKGPVFGMVCRFTAAKGLDLVLEAREFFIRENCRLVVLGSGEKKYEELLHDFAAAYPGKVGLCVRHDEAMSHLVEAGSDFFLMPSLFEPCGLNQMYSQAYGAVPLVSNVGGLVDTVTDIDASPEAGTGIMFPPTQAEFVAGLTRALTLFADKTRYAATQRRAMRRDFSWTTAVAAYEQLYTDAL